MRTISDTSETTLNAHIQIIEIPEKKKRERERGKKIFEEIIVENYPNKRKEIANKSKKHREPETG